jgi:hypothetical protein
MRSKYEQLIEFIINDETEKAKELFHNLVVEKSRAIYNDLVAEEMSDDMDENYDHDMDEMMGHDMDENMDMDEADSMDQTDDMMHDIEADHEGMDGEDDGMDMDMDMDGMDDMGDHDEEDEEDRIDDLADQLEKLQADFAKLMADEKDEPVHNDGKHDPDFADEGVVREYVENMGQPYKQDMNAPKGRNVGADTGEHINPGETNTKSVVASKNDMGGTAKNLAQGQRNEDPNGKAYKGPKNEYSKGEGKFPHSGQFLNAPGGDAGKKGFSNAKKPQSAEGKFATGGGPNVNKRDVLPR